MKYTFLRIGIIVLAVTIAIAGCSKNNGTNPVSSKGLSAYQAVQASLAKSDSVLAFDSSDSATIDDEMALSMEAGEFEKTLTPVQPLRWGRKIENASRKVTVDFPSDSVAIATITRTLSGHFIIVGNLRDSSGMTEKATVRKPFTVNENRKVRFIRVFHEEIADTDWRPAAMTLSSGSTPDSLNKFSIKSIEVDFDTVSYEVTDPLNTWLPFGRFRRPVPVIHGGRPVTVKVTIDSKDDSSEVAFLRHDVGARDTQHSRAHMTLVSSTPITGGSERVYQSSFLVRSLRYDVGLGRFNATVDVLSHGTLYNDSSPVSNIFWGLPYFAAR